jgi:hypothetical protein
MAHLFNYCGAFEVHLTVLIDAEPRLVSFLECCHQLGLKFIQIVLERGMHQLQPMATWREVNMNLSTVQQNSRSIEKKLQESGFVVVRRKIEVDPGNQDVPLNDINVLQHHSQNYFETHIKLLRNRNSGQYQLIACCIKHGAHLSRNAFRHPDPTTEERFVTVRHYLRGRDTSHQLVQDLICDLQAIGEQIVECEFEYCVEDTCPALDQGWLSVESVE